MKHFSLMHYCLNDLAGFSLYHSHQIEQVHQPCLKLGISVYFTNHISHLFQIDLSSSLHFNLTFSFCSMVLSCLMNHFPQVLRELFLYVKFGIYLFVSNQEETYQTSTPKEQVPEYIKYPHLYLHQIQSNLQVLNHVPVKNFIKWYNYVKIYYNLDLIWYLSYSFIYQDYLIILLVVALLIPH